MTYLPNRLNEYETYTYNLKLYMVSPGDLSRLDDSIRDGSAVLLADNSTIATYNISSVEQFYTIGHNLVREAIGNRLTMVIEEPNGVTLLSRLSTLSLQLGIKSHIDARYILDISFHGRDRDGRARKFKPSYLIPLLITSIDFKVTEGGTIYNIELLENGTTGYQYLTNSIRGQITIVAQTVGDFLKKFEEKYNQSIYNDWVTSYTAGRTPDKYIFKFDKSTEAWSRWRFQSLDEPIHVSGVDFIGREDASIQVTIPNGSNITTIIGQVLQLTKEYKNILLKQNHAGMAGAQYGRVDATAEMQVGLDKFPTFFKVITNVEFGEYDIFAGKYSKTIIYKLKAYVVTDEIIDNISYLQSITNVEVQSRRVENLISNNFLRKKFDFYNTGRNTEVLELDLKFDMAYFLVVPFGRGRTGDANVTIPQLNAVSVARRLSARAHRSVNQATAIAEADQTGVGGSEISKWEEVMRLEKIAVEERVNFETIYDKNISEIQEEFKLTLPDINYQLRFVPDVIGDQDVNTSENDKKGGALIMGAVKTNLENDADLLQIELGIRGDPYWFGLPNSLYNQQRDVDEVVDYEAGAPSFFLQVNLPVSGEDNHGRRKPRPDYQLSGVYTVRNVISQFRDGQFIQYLSAVRDLATNVSTVWDLLSGDQDVIKGIKQARQDEQIRWWKQQKEVSAAARTAAQLRRNSGYPNWRTKPAIDSFGF